MAKKILLCENSINYAQLITFLLEDKGYEVQNVFDGEEVVKFLKSNTNYNLVLCNPSIPKLDGFEIARQIQLDEKLRKIPLIFLSDISDITVINRANELGVTDYLIKNNFSINEIADIIIKHLGD